jgi:CO/xanthine dehydrogenase Mo-binding subunit
MAAVAAAVANAVGELQSSMPMTPWKLLRVIRHRRRRARGATPVAP